MKRSPIVANIIEPNIKQSDIWFSRAESGRREGFQFYPGPKGAIVHIIDRKRNRVTVVASRSDGQKPIHRVSLAASYPRQIYVETLKCMAKILELHNWRDAPDTTEVKGWCTVSGALAMEFG